MSREIPRSLQDNPTRIFDCCWYLRRITTSRARYYWAIRVLLPKRLGSVGTQAIEEWWLENHHNLSDRQRKKRRKEGLGNVFLVRCANQALVLTNGNKQFAQQLQIEIRRKVFWQEHKSLPSMELRHLTDGIEFCDLRITYGQSKPQRINSKIVTPGPRTDEWWQRRHLSVVPSEDTMNALQKHLRHICRRREPDRYARRIQTIVGQYNEVLAPWWERYQYCDWEPGQIAYWDKWARHRLLRKSSQEAKRRRGRIRRRAQEKGATAGELGQLPPAKIERPRGFARWLYARCVRLGPRRIWRLGQEEFQPVPIPTFKASGLKARLKEKHNETDV